MPSKQLHMIDEGGKEDSESPGKPPQDAGIKAPVASGPEGIIPSEIPVPPVGSLVDIQTDIVINETRKEGEKIRFSALSLVRVLDVDRSGQSTVLVLQLHSLTNTTRVDMARVTGITPASIKHPADEFPPGTTLTEPDDIEHCLVAHRGSFRDVILTVDGIDWPPMRVIGMTTTQVIGQTHPENALPQDHTKELSRISKVVVQ